ncbi:hypothetical protein HPT29_016325 [Microvirga terrae]|uniref:DUF6894 domain-containing protein n=1 Tax=Microvirga terrae TaxID=2740529 RepID=A0ABY5RLJ4_9HYPH|nr:hypothetical protein [Microvirga terrae]UVF18075.1 hypothetical protein HPT29_016325 [Microvirga terrae]
MPRYFFDTYDGDQFVPDSNGLELPDLAAAKREAQRALADIARDALPDDDQRTYFISVKNEAGQMVLRAGLTLFVETIVGTSAA